MSLIPHPPPPPAPAPLPAPLPPPATEYQNKLGSGHSISGGREDPALRSGNVWLDNLLSLLQPRPQGFSLKKKPWGRGWSLLG